MGGSVWDDCGGVSGALGSLGVAWARLGSSVRDHPAPPGIIRNHLESNGLHCDFTKTSEPNYDVPAGDTEQQCNAALDTLQQHYANL